MRRIPRAAPSPHSWVDGRGEGRPEHAAIRPPHRNAEPGRLPDQGPPASVDGRPAREPHQRPAIEASPRPVSAQVEAKPASTKAPERFLGRGLTELNTAFQARWGMALLREHEATTEILGRAHRFRALHKSGLLSLAKDLARLTADSFDLGALRPLVPTAKSEELGTLKLLERLLATLIATADAGRIMRPLVGVYLLRHMMPTCLPLRSQKVLPSQTSMAMPPGFGRVRSCSMPPSRRFIESRRSSFAHLGRPVDLRRCGKAGADPATNPATKHFHATAGVTSAAIFAARSASARARS